VWVRVPKTCIKSGIQYFLDGLSQALNLTETETYLVEVEKEKYFSIPKTCV